MKTSGATVYILKEMVQDFGEKNEEALLRLLSPGSRIVYDNITPTAWIAMDVDTEIKQAGAKILFPNHPQGAVQLQRLIAQKSLNDQFKVKTAHPTLAYVKSAAEELWNSLWQKGRIAVEDMTDTRMTVTVTDFPELSKTQLELISGYICGILDLTGARNIRTRIDAKNPQTWKWFFRWKF